MNNKYSSYSKNDVCQTILHDWLLPSLDDYENELPCAVSSIELYLTLLQGSNVASGFYVLVQWDI